MPVILLPSGTLKKQLSDAKENKVAVKALRRRHVSIAGKVLLTSLLASLAILSACTADGKNERPTPSVSVTEVGAPSVTPPPTVRAEHMATPTQAANPGGTSAAIRSLAPTPGSPATPASGPALSVAPAPTAEPSGPPQPTARVTVTPTPMPTAAPPPASVSSYKPLAGAPRVQSPLFSYDNQDVYTEVSTLVSGQNSFVADFYRQLAGEADGNLFYSPYSLYTAMGVVFAGADGETAAQFQEVMDIQTSASQFHRNLNSLDLTMLNDSVRPGDAGEESSSPPTLAVANGLWLQDSLEVLPDFLNTVTANYGIELARLDFLHSPDEAVSAINQWVDKATQGKIKGAISRDSITEHTSLVVTNAVYFKGDWEDQFEEEYTYDELFYLLDGLVVEVPMMFQRNDYRRAIAEGYQAVELPYRGNGFDLLVIMPDEGTFETFEESLTGDRLQTITENMGWGPVILRMPRFKLEYSFSAKEGLEALGLSDAFDRDRADFRHLADRLFGLPLEALWIEDAVQKAFVEVNEEGSEAAAATAFFGGATATSIPPPPVEITIDRPFIFLLRHSDTGAVLFMGRVLNPDPEASATVYTPDPPTPTPTPTQPARIPAIFHGIATLNGAPAPPGTEIQALDGTREIGSTIATENGQFLLEVWDAAGPITFKVGGLVAQEKALDWVRGNITANFDLHAGR